MDLVVEGRAFLGGRLVEAMVGIEGGKIARVAKSLPSSVVAGARRVQVRGVLLPGAVDAHVHAREPGLEHKERVATATLAALHGGVTTVLEMPNTAPAVTTRATFGDKRARWQAAARVDWGLHAMVDRDLQTFELGGAPVGYKLYLGGSTGAAGFPLGLLGSAARRATAAGRPLVVHAEHPDHLQEQDEADDWRAHGKARPPEAEWAAIKVLAAYVPKGARVVVAHATTAKGLKAARKAGLRVEVSPHHLLLDEREMDRQGPLAKVNPPLRGPKQREALWEAFAKGTADTLASDHAPHALDEKDAPFDKAPSGMPGVETMMPLMMAKVKAKGLSLAVLVKAACERPAQLFGLPKGQIAEGSDADLVAWDLTKVGVVEGAKLHSLCGWSAFEGHKAVWPHWALLRGEPAMEDGAALDTKGREVAPA
ncbi:MAG TPA: dihydroorotase [Candidatus Thermoplasmatota archaeon]|nr:dihydroorotase [Candidatus Thermoplasmatota archaeon]